MVLWVITMSRKKEPSPYKNFTVEQVMEAERDRYIIQVGGEIFYEGNYCAFSKERTEEYWDLIQTGITDMIKNGNAKERADALNTCLNLRIIPLRIQ